MVNNRAEFSLAAEQAVDDFVENRPNHVVFTGCVSEQQKRNKLLSMGSFAFATFFKDNKNDKFMQYVNFPDDAAKQRNERRNLTKQLKRLVKNDDDADVAGVVNNNNNFTNLSNVDLTHNLSAAQSNPNVAAAAAAAAPSADVLGVNNTNTDYDATSLLTPLRPTTNTESNAAVEKLTGIAAQLTERSLVYDRDFGAIKETLTAFAHVSNKHESDIQLVKSDVKKLEKLFMELNTPAKPAASQRVSFAPMTPTSVLKKKQPAAIDDVDVTSLAMEEQIQTIHI